MVFDLPINASGATAKLASSLAKLPQDEAIADASACLTNAISPIIQLKPLPKSISGDQAKHWNQANRVFLTQVPEMDRFPAVDILRYAFLSREIGLALLPSLKILLSAHQNFSGNQQGQRPKNLVLLELRLFTNATDVVFTTHRDALTHAAVEGLLHAESSVRSAAASLAFKIAQTNYILNRVDWLDSNPAEAEDHESWETEIASALIEALKNETDGDVCELCESLSVQAHWQITEPTHYQATV